MANKNNGSCKVGFHAMMIRVPNDVYAELVAEAVVCRRSVSGEAVWLIEEGLSKFGTKSEADR